MSNNLEEFKELFLNRIRSEPESQRILPFSPQDIANLTISDQVALREIIAIDWDTAESEENLIKLTRVFSNNPHFSKTLSLFVSERAKRTVFNLSSVNKDTAQLLASTVKNNLSATDPNIGLYQQAVNQESRDKITRSLEQFSQEVSSTKIE